MRIRGDLAIAFGTLFLAAIMLVAIANQAFSWWVYPFGILFGTIFLGVLSICFLNYREDRYRSSRVDVFPDEPWMWDARWRSAIMISRSTSEFWGTLAFTVILGVFALMGIASLLTGLAEGNLWVLLNLIPIAAAAYFGRNAYIAWRTLRLERNISLSNETRPAWIGAGFSARMKTMARHHPEDVEAWLEHIKIVRNEESDGVSFEKVVDRRLPGLVEDTGSGEARIFVDIPQNNPATSWIEGEQGSWWDLVISMRLSDAKVSVRYEIPVADPAKHQTAGA